MMSRLQSLLTISSCSGHYKLEKWRKHAKELWAENAALRSQVVAAGGTLPPPLERPVM
jgi:hypothetical protein